VRCVLVGLAVTASLALLVLVLRRTVSDQAFSGRTALTALLLLGLVGLLAEHVLRGLFSGNERFGRYGRVVVRPDRSAPEPLWQVQPG
jgi:hypothetical protein